MCQLHSVAGTKTLTLFHVFGVECPSEREGGGRAGLDERDQERQAQGEDAVFRSNERDGG